MKICLAICEYNPLHNGHLKHLDYIKKNLKCDYTAVILSGNFTQRGETAVMNKYLRAKHAVMSGADIVFELPAVFAVAPAEIFARGAVKLLSELPGEKYLCFGTESGTEENLTATAKALITETKEFKLLLKEELKTGVTHIKAKINALTKMNLENVNFDLLNSPNNILGIEYTKAVLSNEKDIKIRPIIRGGAGYNDREIYKDLSSAAAIRKAIADGKLKKIKNNLPSYVYADLPETLPSADELIFYSLITTPKADLKNVLDCTEGLENRIKALIKDSKSIPELMEKLKTKRYTESRLKRIVMSNMLGIRAKFVRRCLNSELYLKVLAVKKDSLNLLSDFQKNCELPFLTRKSDFGKLSGTALECFNTDVKANDIYNLVTKGKTNEFDMKII